MCPFTLVVYGKYSGSTFLFSYHLISCRMYEWNSSFSMTWTHILLFSSLLPPKKSVTGSITPRTIIVIIINLTRVIPSSRTAAVVRKREEQSSSSRWCLGEKYISRVWSFDVKVRTECITQKFEHEYLCLRSFSPFMALFDPRVLFHLFHVVSRMEYSDGDVQGWNSLGFLCFYFFFRSNHHHHHHDPFVSITQQHVVRTFSSSTLSLFYSITLRLPLTIFILLIFSSRSILLIYTLTFPLMIIIIIVLLTTRFSFWGLMPGKRVEWTFGKKRNDLKLNFCHVILLFFTAGEYPLKLQPIIEGVWKWWWGCWWWWWWWWTVIWAIRRECVENTNFSST